MEHKPIAIIILPVFVTGILMLGILAATGNAQESSNTGTTSGAVSGADQKTILDMHNNERAAVRVPDLVWSNSLAADAKTWLDKLVAESAGNVMTGGLRHDPVNTGLTCTLGPACQGENLAFAARGASAGPPVAPSVAQLVGGWVAESHNPHALNHYTQMVWHSTTHVGCATAEKRGMTSNGFHAVGVYLNCRYSPPGNGPGPAY
jgi:pathogenesis-related protein 1